MNQSSGHSRPPLGTAHLSIFRALARLLSRAGSARVWLMYSKDLTKPMAAYHAKVDVDIDLADDAEMDQLAALYHHDEPEEAPWRARIYRDRLKGGSLCFVARINGAIVASNWIRVKTAVGADQLRMFFEDDEIYTTDAYTAHEWRGQGIHPALNQTMLEYAHEQGYRIAYTLVRADNERSWVTMDRVGWQHVGTMLYFRPKWKKGRAFWQVWGDPYPMPVWRGAVAVADTAAGGSDQATVAGHPGQSDAASFDLAQFDERELVSDWPWAKTYRLRKGDQLAWLKIIPSEQAGVLLASVLLARQHPSHLPQVLACDHQQHGWLLTRDHGGSLLGPHPSADDLQAMVESYARLQAAAASDSELMACLPAAEVARALPLLIDFLDSERIDPDTDDRVGAAFFIGAADAATFRAVLEQASALLIRHLAQAASLPDTVNHGDLNAAHAAKKASEDIVLFNWSRATRGPAGLSLHSLFGGALPAVEALQQHGDGGIEQDLKRLLMARYVDSLARAGYADETALRGSLQVSIIAGAMLDLLRYADFPTEEAGQREVIRNLLLAGLQDLQKLCVFLAL